MEKEYTVKELAEIMSVGQAAIRAHIYGQRLKATKKVAKVIREDWFIKKSDFEEFREKYLKQKP